MSANYARLTTLTYAVAAALCLTLPLIRPSGSRGGVVVALLLGAPLATLAGLLAWLHRALRLQRSSDWAVAAAYCSAALLFVQPVLYWVADVPNGLEVIVPAVAAVAVIALVGLAIRTWQRASRGRFPLVIGVLLVADPFAWSVYLAFWGAPGHIDPVGLLEEFFVSWSVAALVLLLGLFRLRVASVALSESRLTSA